MGGRELCPETTAMKVGVCPPARPKLCLELKRRDPLSERHPERSWMLPAAPPALPRRL